MVQGWVARAAVVGAILSGLSSTATAADLLAIYREAKTHDASYAIAQTALSAAKEKIPQGLAALLPSVSAQVSTNYNDRDIDFRDGTRSAARYNNNSAGVSVSIPLLRWQNFAQFEQAKAQVEQAKLQFEASTQDLALRVAQAYFDVLLAQDNLRLARIQAQALARQLEQAQQQFKLGSGSMADIREAQARSDLAAAQTIAADNELLAKRDALQVIVRHVPERLAPMTAGLALEQPEPDNIATWVEQALTANPQVRVQRAAIAVAEQEVRKNRYGHYPTLDAVASVSNAGTGSGVQGGIGNDTSMSTIGLQLVVPLYQGGATVSRVREAVVNHGKSQQELDAVTRQVTAAARQAFLGVKNGIASIRAFEAAIASSQSQLDATRLGREVGLRTSVDILNAQQQLFQAQRDLAQARYAYAMNHLRLRAIVGKLDDAEMARFSAKLTAAAPAATTPPAEPVHAGVESPPDTAVADRPALVAGSTAVEANPVRREAPRRPAVRARSAPCGADCGRRPAKTTR